MAGFTLAEIAALVDVDGRVAPDWREHARAKVAELDAELRKLKRAKALLEHTLRCPKPVLHECPVFRRGVDSHAAAMAR
jgi:hypothetical protein